MFVHCFFKDQLNALTLSWGMEVTNVELSDLKIMKQPEMHAAGVFRTLCQPHVASSLLQCAMKGGSTMPIISQDDPKLAPILGKFSYFYGVFRCIHE